MWEKLGLIYKAEDYKNDTWKSTHGYIPTPIELEDCIRVFISCWDENKFGRLSYVDLDKTDITKVLGVSEFPILIDGETGFDCKGVTPISYFIRDGSLYLIYTGWGSHDKYPYTLFTGVAVSENNGESFIRIRYDPILMPIPKQETIRTAAFVLYEDYKYKFWYVGGNTWVNLKGKQTPLYDLFYVESDIIYTLNNKVPQLSMKSDIYKGEFAIGRPCILKENDKYTMYYSSRTIETGYVLKQAESVDGITWENNTEITDITNNKQWWETDMQCFAYVLKASTGTYMFYNGNQHGIDGFGGAKLI